MKIYGNGSVEKRGKKDHWRLSVVTGYNQDKNGKKRPIKLHKTIFANGKKAAKRELAEWITELRRSPEQANEPGVSSITVAELMRRYIDDCSLRDLSIKTIEGYEEIADHRINPVLGTIGIQNVTTGMLTDFYRHLKKSGKQDGSSLSSGTIKKVVYLLNGAFKRAVADGYLDANPNDNAETFTSTRGAPKKEQEVLFEKDDMTHIVYRAKYCPNHGLGTAIMLAAFAALRRGEVCGLTWGDVDFEASKLTITHDLIEVKKKDLNENDHGQTLRLGLTKTEASEAPVPMAPTLRDYLLEERTRQETEAEYFGTSFCNETPVVRNKRGGWMRPSTLTTEFKTFVRDDEELNDQASFKSLRSGAASLLAAEGVPITAVSAILRHTNLNTTMQHYIKHYSEDAKKAIGVLNEQISAQI